MVTVVAKNRIMPTGRENRGNYDEKEKIGITAIMNTQNNPIVY